MMMRRATAFLALSLFTVAIAPAGATSGAAASPPGPSADLPPAAATSHPEAENYRLLGTLGPYHIGATLSVVQDQKLTSASYFYTKNLVDIPLTGQIAGEQITLDEPGGGHFSLHFTTSDKTATKPLSLHSATELAGTWQKGTQTYPVLLTLDATDSLTPDTLYESVTDAPPAVFEAMVRHFLKSALSGNKADTAKLVSWPLRINGQHTQILKTPEALFAAWPHIFTPCLRLSLQRAVPHTMFVHNGEAMVDNGTIWFDAHGASAINMHDCKSASP
ncbi:hypothetical protein KBX73_03350 [Acetobacter persici]|uniref:hypothetical protein n=1 Tax=Acetobacter persici TaxID=1076596 RepID=UPI0020CDE611|nr:hypothetical protein [Acetobacter persici]MCP9318827.1 hypothetical protein [Acetobacter persici]